MINQKGTVSDHTCSSSAAWRVEEVMAYKGTHDKSEGNRV